MIAEYQCTSCEFEWSVEVEGGTMPLKHEKVHSSECPKCGSLYFKWVNFDKPNKVFDK